MAEQGRTTLKGYFETGDTPTQAQFEDLIDSNFNLTDNDSDNITEGATNLFLTSSERSKLSGVEANADVTNATNVGAVNAAATSKTTPIDADSFPIVDSEASNVIKRLTFTNLKAFLKTWLDSLTTTFTNKTIDADNNTITNIGTSELADDGVTFAKIENIATNRILGRSAAGTGSVEALTLTDARSLLNVEDGADVTDTANVTAAGALMDSEVINLAQVKAFDSSDYATAAQGATADSALQDVVDDTTPQLGGDLYANSKRILNVSQIDSNSIVKNSQTLLITTGAATFKSIKGNFATITLTENTTIGFQITGGEELILEVTPDTTTRTVTFTNVLWAEGIAPTITVASGAKDVFRFTCINDVIYGEIIGQNMR